MSIPVLHTERLILRPLHEGDFDDLYEYAQDPEVAGPGMWQPYESEEAARAHLAQLLTLYERGLMWWGMECQADNRLIGRCELGPYDPDDARAELGYALNRHYWGKGYMSEAIQAVLRYGFEALKLNRVSAKVFTDNTASLRLLEKFGMTREGTMRQFTQVRGKPEAVYLYALLREEWTP